MPKGKNMAIRIHHHDQIITVPFETLPQNGNASVLFGLAQISPRPLCTGMGKCGRCKIQYLNNVPEPAPLELVLLTDEERANAVRLACKHTLADNTELAIFDDLQQNAVRLELHFSNPHHIGEAELFVDLGTTSVAFEIRADEQVLAEGKLLNPQMFAGADVMSRLYYEHFVEKKKPSRLQTVILELLRQICTQSQNNGIGIKKILLAANPSMTALFLGESVSGLLEAPYYLENKGDKEYIFPNLPPVYIPPQLAPFIGADAMAGLAYILHTQPQPDNFLLADLGTNGEFIYYSGGKLFAASIPLGPALEGVGMRCGSAVHGKGENIILNFSLTPAGLAYACEGSPQYICGAAYLELVRILLSVGILDRQGLFQESTSPLSKKISRNITEYNGEKRLYITDTLYLCPEDIENILKVKAAFSSAIELFLQKNPIENIFLSGALSSHIPLETMENLGFLPQNSKHKTTVAGNTSLLGLIACRHAPQLADTLKKLSEQAVIIDLTNQPEYNSLYIDNMHF